MGFFFFFLTKKDIKNKNYFESTSYPSPWLLIMYNGKFFFNFWKRILEYSNITKRKFVACSIDYITCPNKKKKKKLKKTTRSTLFLAKPTGNLLFFFSNKFFKIKLPNLLNHGFDRTNNYLNICQG